MAKPVTLNQPHTPSRGLLMAAFALLVAFFLITHTLTMAQQRVARTQTETVVSNMFSSIELVARMGRDIARERLLADAHIFEKEARPMERLEADMRAAQADYSAAALAYEPIATLPGEATTWQKLQIDAASLEAPLNHTLALSRMNQDAEAREALLTLESRFSAIDDDMRALRRINREGADKAVATVKALERSTAFLTAMRSAVGILLSLAIGAFITRRIGQREEQTFRHRLALEESNRELEAFAGRVAHDLREPLTTVAMAASKLAQVAPEQGMTGHLQRGVTRMEVLIEDLLTLSRLGANVQEGVADTSATVEQIREDLQEKLKDEVVALRIDVEPARVRCAAGLLRQVVWNLANNSIKYRRSDTSAELEIRGRIVGKTYRLSVRDNGQGMSTDDARQAFEPFYRSVRTRSTPGTGLGLAIVKRVVDASGGTISVESRLGEGSTFLIHLPLAESAAAEEATPIHRSRAPA